MSQLFRYWEVVESPSGRTPNFGKSSKRQGAKRVREMLRRDLASRVAELEELDEPDSDLIEDFYDDWDWFHFEPLPPKAIERIRRIYRNMKEKENAS